MKNDSKSPSRSERFSHAVGHDIKQPLGLIRAYSYYIKKNVKDTMPSLVQYSEKIDQQVDLVTNMLNNIVESAKLSENLIIFKHESVELLSTLKNVLIVLQSKYPTASVTLSHIDPEYFVTGDAVYLSEAFHHIIENAVQYSSTEIPVVIDVNSKKDCVVITITNSGSTIPEKEFQHIFEEYVRGSNAKVEGIKGMGLGLFIAQKVIAAHQGSIVIASKNSITHCTITLPLHSFLR